MGKTRDKTSFFDLKRDVVDRGLCTACGTCVGVCLFDAISIDYESDEPIPILTGECTECDMCYPACPGKNVPLRTLDKTFLGSERDFERDKIGIYTSCNRGYAMDEEIRLTSSSGGIVSSLLIFALEEKLIEGAILTGWRKDKPWRCKPYIATTKEEVMRGIRTGMMIVPNNALLAEAVTKKQMEKIAVVGLPCHIHGLRKLQMRGKPKKLVNAIQFCIGLFCASTYYWEGTKHLLQESGKIKNLEDIVAMDYRGGKPPGDMFVLTRDGKFRFVATKHDYVWHLLGSASYKRDRCLMCVDFSAELADISCGDVFQRIEDKPGPFVATVARTETGEGLLQMATEKGYIHLEHHDPDMIPSSGMGWEAKKHAGVYRWLERSRYGWPVPDYEYEISESPLPRDLKFPG